MSRSLRCPSYVSLRHGHRVHDVSSSWCSVFLGVLVSIYTYVCVPASCGSVMVPGLSNMLLPLGSKMWLLENKPTAKSGNCSRTQNIILKNDAAQGVLVWSLLEVLQLTKLRCWVLCAVASCALLGSLGVARVRSVGVDDKKLGVPFRSSSSGRSLQFGHFCHRDMKRKPAHSGMMLKPTDALQTRDRAPAQVEPLAPVQKPQACRVWHPNQLRREGSLRVSAWIQSSWRAKR